MIFYAIFSAYLLKITKHGKEHNQTNHIAQAGTDPTNKADLNAKSQTNVTYDEEETIVEDGFTIEVVPLYKFLLR